MKKSKFIKDESRIQYEKNLKELSQQINPKPPEEERKKIIEQLKKERR